MPIPHLGRDGGGAGIIGLMHDGALAVEHPMSSGRALDPNAGSGAGDDPGGTKNSLGLLCLDLERRALAHGQAKRAAEQAAQALVGQRPEAFVIDRQGMKARPERLGRRDRWRQCFRRNATLPAAAREAAMTHGRRFDRRYLDLAVFTD